MEVIDLPFFPFPRVVRGQRISGYLMHWPHQCDGCDRQCEQSSARGLSVCSYGVNYWRIGENQIIFGILAQGRTTTAAQRKAARRHPENRVSPEAIERAADRLATAQGAIEQEIAAAKAESINSYIAREGFKRDFLENLKPEIQKNLAFLHDYKQFVARVKQNINVVLKTRYGSGDTDQLLSKALPSEVAIYWASSLMMEKLQTAFLLLHPERLQSGGNRVSRLHGMVIKYVRIYQSSFDDKGIRVEVRGTSNGEIYGDPSALGVIPQTLLDNALKYSERGSKVVVEFKESAEAIVFSVTSFGPRIESDEASRIFDLFYRGRNAIKAQEEGAGFGLHLAQFVARSHSTEIIVRQDATRTKLGFETCFSVQFNRVR